ncbi:protein-glutamine gamma-glutamyltransferase 2 [Diretmus argenteus]
MPTKRSDTVTTLDDQLSRVDSNDIISKQMDTLFLDTDFANKISKILMDSLIEPVKKAIAESITETVKETIQYELKGTAEKLNELQQNYDDLIDNLDEQEQYSRRNCLIVFGVPEQKDESTTKLVCDIFKANLKIEVLPSEIDRSHRLGRKPENPKAKPRGIIIKFTKYYVRDNVFKAKRALKNSQMQILENVTTKRVKLLADLREKYKDKVTASWTRDGRIHLLTHKKNLHVISKLSDIIFKQVDFHCKTNNADHRTSEITWDQLIVRRGQSFLLTLVLSKPFTPESDQLLITAVTGSKASEEQGTRSVFGIPEGIAASSPSAKAVWKAELHDSSFLLNGSVTLTVTPPADTPVGKYTLSMTNKMQETQIGSLVVLFNPWCSDDWVFLPNEDERQEYVMNEQGVIYKGSGNYIIAMPWDYGQFEEDMVSICLQLLDVNPKHLRDPADDVSARCNPIYVGRVVSAMINSADDKGVLVGRWDGYYRDGTMPAHWSGSIDILRSWFYNGGRRVKYGQCWVFAAVMCTVMRLLGIPCRVVTNYQSAHDTNKNLSIDVFHADYGLRPKNTNDSVWNFHVWVEAWMKRPDLKEDGSYDGWQVLDPTPQEKSDGVYCCGPAPVAAIRKGDIHLKYDIPFTFAEVNADCIDWLIFANGEKMKIYSDTKRVGHNISTKSVGSDKRKNITGTYKHGEGTTKERSVFEKAITRDFTRQISDTLANVEEGTWRNVEENADEGGGASNGTQPPLDVSMWFEEVTKPVSGQDVNLRLMLDSRDLAPRPLSVNISVQAMRYTGVPAANMQTEVKEDTLQPGQGLSIPIIIPFSVYGKHMVDCDSLKVSAVAKDKQQPENIYLAEDDVVLQDPPISITVSEKPQQHREMTVEVFFKNPVQEKLRDCSLTLSGSGLLKEKIHTRLADLPPGQQIRVKFIIVPYKAGRKSVVADFDCSLFRDIKSSCTFHVTPYSYH